MVNCVHAILIHLVHFHSLRSFWLTGFILVHFYSFSLTGFSLYWFILVHFGSFWFILVHFGTFSLTGFILVHFGSFPFIFVNWVHFGSFWFIFVHFGSFSLIPLTEFSPSKLILLNLASKFAIFTNFYYLFIIFLCR